MIKRQYRMVKRFSVRERKPVFVFETRKTIFGIGVTKWAYGDLFSDEALAHEVLNKLANFKEIIYGPYTV